ncbi:MAG: class II aldolase/adducin family protein [Betaproteobacteria bacterium]|nr:class II aldolase/adducin family protein [Betaproteobacteria bacterium]
MDNAFPNSPSSIHLRAAVLATARRMAREGLNSGTAGNVSARFGEGFVITPTGLAYHLCTARDVADVDMDGNWTGPRLPSSEWRFHRDIYATRREAGAVVHAHSPFATALACIGDDIPPFHYMIARFGGANVRCAPYATFGTQELSGHAMAALEDRCACLLANHGMLVFGRDLEHALDLAVEFETLCEHYWRARQVGTPRLLDETEMAVVLKKFGSYGQPPAVGGK